MESIGLPYSDENRCDSSELDGVPSVASRYAGGLSPRVERCDQRIRQEDEFRIFERADIEQSIPARFAKQVRQYPDSVAVSWDGLRLTYKELNQEANRTACEILKRIGDAEEPVAFLLDHGGWAIAAILGILKAGKGYLALDPSFPRDRTAALLHDSTARLVVTEEKHLPLVGPIGREKTMILSRRLGSQGSMDDPAVGILPSRMATLYYTSGSTGEPKGVVQSHRNVLHNVMEMTNSGRLCPTDHQSLRKTLPDHMIPAHFITLEQIPITTNGKVDRMRLPPPGDARPELATPYHAPRDELEARLAVIWEEILGIHPVGLKDRFDDLGADSLHYVNLIALIAKKLGMEFSLDRFVEEPTIEHLACLLHGPQREASPHVNVRDDTNPYRLVAYRGLEHNTPWKKTIKGVFFKLLSVFGDILPYGLASGMSASFCGTRLAQQHFFNYRARIMAKVLTAIETPMSREDALREFLVCRLLRDTRIAILARLGPSGFDRWVTVKGLPHLQQALHRGRGVILLDSHYGLPHFEMVTLQRLGLENVLVIGGWPTQMQLLGIKHWRQIKMREDYEPAKRFMMGPIAMQAAREFLAAGGIVRMAPDGDVGAGGSSFPFWGRERTFRHGFANLVVDTAASALPTMVTLESSGRVQVEFFEPFDPGDVTESRKARVERLVMHYVRFLEGMWALHPGNVREADLQAFLAARACSLVTMQGPTMFESE